MTAQQSGTAVISECGHYRYRLTRRWSDAPGSVTWIMLNPSTADASQDDPTIRRCIAFSKRWGCGSLTVCNLYAYRATNPAELWTVPDPVGPENNNHLIQAGGDLFVCAWGANAKPERAEAVLELIDGLAPVMCLGTTKGGAPRHPLYVAGETPLQALS
jgi:hypothetical protein